jgi:hypothetical protein
MDTLRALLDPVSHAVMEACLKAPNEVSVETSASNADVKKTLRFADGLPGRQKSLVAGRGTLRQSLHDPHAPEGVKTGPIEIWIICFFLGMSTDVVFG